MEQQAAAEQAITRRLLEPRWLGLCCLGGYWTVQEY